MEGEGISGGEREGRGSEGRGKLVPYLAVQGLHGDERAAQPVLVGDVHEADEGIGLGDGVEVAADAGEAADAGWGEGRQPPGGEGCLAGGRGVCLAETEGVGAGGRVWGLWGDGDGWVGWRLGEPALWRWVRWGMGGGA